MLLLSILFAPCGWWQWICRVSQNRVSRRSLLQTIASTNNRLPVGQTKKQVATCFLSMLVIVRFNGLSNRLRKIVHQVFGIFYPHAEANE